MRPAPRLATTAVLAGVVTVGCSPASPRPGDLGDVVPSGGEEAGVESAEASTSSPPLLDVGLGVGVTDVPDTTCAPSSGTTLTVVGLDVYGSQPYRSLWQAGSRWVADFVSGAGFVTLDGDGTNVTEQIGTTPIAFGFAASSGNGFVLGGVGDGVALATYDDDGWLQGPSVQLSTETPTDIGLASGATSSLVAWGAATGVRGRGVNGGGPVGSGAFDLALTSLTGGLSLSVVDDGDGLFAFVFSGDDGGTTHQTVFGRATEQARAGDPVAIFTGPAPTQVVQLVKTNNGYALLVTSGDVTPRAFLVILDSAGSVVRASRLLGTSAGTSLASLGNEVGVVAIRSTELDPDAGDVSAAFAPEFRPFDDTGTPLGPWVCLGEVSGNPEVGAVVAANGTGYAALVNASDGSVQLATFDHLGAGN